jgi:hypothetical protein
LRKTLQQEYLQIGLFRHAPSQKKAKTTEKRSFQASTSLSAGATMRENRRNGHNHAEEGLMHCLTIGEYIVTLDEQGAYIERGQTGAIYRIIAATATNAVDFMRQHSSLCLAMMTNYQAFFAPKNA